jgi:tetratricopeptide (TPR) repeat protein
MAPTADNRAEVEKVLGEIDAALARAESQKLFDSGNEKFQKEEYDDAIADWEAGHAKEPSAAFLYNIGQAHKLAGRRDDARTYLERYLEAQPDSPRRAEVVKDLKRLKPRRR